MTCSKRLPLVNKFNTDSYFNPIAQYDLTCTDALLIEMHSKCLVMVKGQYDKITLFNLKCRGGLCVREREREENLAKFCSEYLKEQGLLGRTRHR